MKIVADNRCREDKVESFAGAIYSEVEWIDVESKEYDSVYVSVVDKGVDFFMTTDAELVDFMVENGVLTVKL